MWVISFSLLREGGVDRVRERKGGGGRRGLD